MRHPLAIALVLGALLLPACSDAPGSMRESLPDEIDYVALGDSFTSGPFIGFERDDEGCSRSMLTYPVLLAEELGTETFRSVACAGARTSHVARPQPLFGGGLAAPQVEALSSETDLVTIGLGANDSGIYAGLIHCSSLPTCSSLDTLLGRAREVQGAVEDVVALVRQRSPDAAVVLVGYPQILPESLGCDDAPAPSDALARLDEVLRTLNESLRQAAESTGSTFVDVQSSSRGHDVCAGVGAWVVGRSPGPGQGAPYHPNAEGMGATAERILEVMSG